MTRQMFRYGVLLLCLAVGVGCGGNTSGRKLVKVSGTVKLDGKPLAQGTVSFVTDGNGANNAAGEINSSGQYSLGTTEKGDGAPPGRYKVRIESWAAPPQMDEKGFNPGKSAIPERYNQVTTSELTAEVKDSPSSQSFDFDLKP